VFVKGQDMTDGLTMDGVYVECVWSFLSLPR